MILADVREFVSHAFIVLLTIGLPAVGLVINIAGMQRRGLNRLCALASCIFFGNLIIQGITTTLAAQDGISEKVQLAIFAGTAVVNCLSALLAHWGLLQVRRRHKWPRGKKRAIATIWLNVCVLLILATYFFFRTNPAAYDRIMNG
jgi:hypothetical protein